MHSVQNLSKTKFENENFSGRDLQSANLSWSIFKNCNFDKADLSGANCERSDFRGSTFRETNCGHTNFKDATLAGTIFEPSNAYGMTLTLQCQTFRGVRISQLWWLGYITFASMMVCAPYPVQEQWNDKLIALIGAERYVKLRALFQRREI